MSDPALDGILLLMYSCVKMSVFYLVRGMASPADGKTLEGAAE